MRITSGCLEGISNLEYKSEKYIFSPDSNISSDLRDEQKRSFRRAKKTRRRKNAEQILSRSMTQKKENLKIIVESPPSPGPTRETQAKLQPDPLNRLYKNGTLSQDHMVAARKIRRAFELITAGATIRLSSYSDVIVQTSRHNDHYESDREVMLKGRYADWVDDMTAQKLQVGPVFDIVIEEMSLAAVDCKWRRRKGWARGHLKQALELYLHPDFEQNLKGPDHG